jgi:hypothetical protein
MKHWLVMIVALLGMAAYAAPVAAQNQINMQGVATCSQAADRCSDYCGRVFGGSVDSAKCVDACTLARAKCDRDGCFNTEMGSICELSKR